MQPTQGDTSPIWAVGGVVYRYAPGGRLELLLIKKRHGLWTFPKGHVEPGEAGSVAAVREVREEAGVTTTVEAIVDRVAYDILKQGRRRHKIVTYYLLRAETGQVCADPHEGIEYVRWFTWRAALRRIGRERVRMIARHACAMLKLCS